MKKRYKNTIWITIKPQAKVLLDAYVYAKNLKRTALLRRWIYKMIDEEVVKNALVTNTQVSRYNRYIKEHGLRKRSNNKTAKEGGNDAHRNNKR